jgi:hypothetical protein
MARWGVGWGPILARRGAAAARAPADGHAPLEAPHKWDVTAAAVARRLAW